MISIEEAVSRLPPFQQRRMAKMALAGVKFKRGSMGLWKGSLPWPNLQHRGSIETLFGPTGSLNYMINGMWKEFVERGLDGDQ